MTARHSDLEGGRAFCFSVSACRRLSAHDFMPFPEKMIDNQSAGICGISHDAPGHIQHRVIRIRYA
jgi:hypothetical protein